MNNPNYELIAIYGQTDEEKRMCARSKEDAIRAGRKAYVLPGKGEHKGMLCLYMHKKHVAKGETPEHSGKRTYTPGPVRVVTKTCGGRRSTTWAKKTLAAAQA